KIREQFFLQRIDSQTPPIPSKQLIQLCEFCGNDKPEPIQQAAAEILSVFISGGDQTDDPELMGMRWLKLLIDFQAKQRDKYPKSPLGSVIQHAIVRSLIRFSETHPPDKFFVQWEYIFPMVLVVDFMKALPLDDCTSASRILTLFASSSPNFERIRLAVPRTLPLLGIPNTALQVAVLDILIEAAKNGNSERLSLDELQGTDWCLA
ncbi:MAG: hypothetical protein EZS28_054051, partial [Streblomastix strix]